jgi:hypothetical protein
MLRAFLVVCFLCTTTAAQALDHKELMPCRTAAARLCDKSQGMNVSALWRCGATLASRRIEVGATCVEVLKRFGQL